MAETYFKLGNLVFRLSGEDIALPPILEELQSIACSGSQKYLLEFKFGHLPVSAPEGVIASPVTTSPDALLYSGNSFDICMTQTEGISHVSLVSQPFTWKRRMFPRLARFVHWNFLSPAQEYGKNFMYDTFDYITQIANLRAKQSYFHASSFEKGGKGVAIVAWSGIGKTTAMLKLVGEDHWNFLSDDLGVIDETGTIYRTPKRLQIYGYNLKGQVRLKEKLFHGRSLADRTSWHFSKWLRGPAGVRRRISAEELFGEHSVARSAKLSKVLFIERAHTSEIVSLPLAVSQLARRAAYCVMKEITPYFQLASAVYSVQAVSDVLPPFEELFKNTEQTLLKAFGHLEPVLIKLPVRATPDDLAGYLRVLLKDIEES